MKVLQNALTILVNAVQQLSCVHSGDSSYAYSLCYGDSFYDAPREQRPYSDYATAQELAWPVLGYGTANRFYVYQRTCNTPR